MEQEGGREGGWGGGKDEGGGGGGGESGSWGRSENVRNQSFSLPIRMKLVQRPTNFSLRRTPTFLPARWCWTLGVGREFSLCLQLVLERSWSLESISQTSSTRPWTLSGVVYIPGTLLVTLN